MCQSITKFGTGRNQLKFDNLLGPVFLFLGLRIFIVMSNIGGWKNKKCFTVMSNTGRVKKKQER